MSSSKKPKYEDDEKKTEAETTKAKATTKDTSIFDLPLLVMLTIFDYLPLVTLFHLDEVCRDWQALKITALGRRKRLIIVEKEEDLYKLEKQPQLAMLRAKAKEAKAKGNDSAALLEPLPRHPLLRHTLYSLATGGGDDRGGMSPFLVDQVIKRLPALHSLTIFSNRPNSAELWKIKLLLTAYRRQLTSLAIWFWNGSQRERWNNKFQREIDEEEEKEWQLFDSLMDALNSLPALRCLRLHLQSAFGCGRVTLPLEVARPLQVLHLSSFGLLYTDFINNDFGDIMSDSACDWPLVKSVFEGVSKEDEGKDEQLQLQQKQPQQLYTENSSPLDALLSFGPRVSAALRQVGIDEDLSKEQITDFGRFTEKYAALRQLMLTIGTASLAEVARELSTGCPQLAHLTLTVNFDPDKKQRVYVPEEEREWDEEERVVPVPVTAANDHLPGEQLPVVGSVTTLDLYVSTASHRDFEQQMNLDVLFPAVQYLTLEHSFHRCSECGDDDPTATPPPPHPNQTEALQQWRNRPLSRHTLQCIRKSRHPWAARLAHLRVLHWLTFFGPDYIKLKPRYKLGYLKKFQQEYLTREDLLLQQQEMFSSSSSLQK